MDSKNPVSAGLVTLLAQTYAEYIFLEFDQYYKPKYFIDQAAPRFELGIKDLQSPALPLGHAAKKSERKSKKEQVFVHVFLRKPLLFYLEYNSTYFFPIFFFSKNLFLLFLIQFLLFSSIDSILKQILLIQ